VKLCGDGDDDDELTAVENEVGDASASRLESAALRH
jgi:hypothetical protein